VTKPLQSQIAVVTGATSGVGRAIALTLAEQGAIVCLVGRNEKALRLVTEEVRRVCPQARSFKVDLTLDDEIRELERALEQEFDRLHILVHSAAVIALGRLEKASIENLDHQYQVNVRAPFIVTQLLLPLLRMARGQIVFINSSVGVKAQAHASQYAATKHALRAMADSLRDEVNADGLRVLSVFLGRTATPMQAEIHRWEGKEYHPEQLIQPQDVSRIVSNLLSLSPTVEVTEIHIRPMLKS
jgi:NAD(P)-dependent dehydrogenase (short-subunit alcohol dehydrogenase family)